MKKYSLPPPDLLQVHPLVRRVQHCIHEIEDSRARHEAVAVRVDVRVVPDKVEEDDGIKQLRGQLRHGRRSDL